MKDFKMDKTGWKKVTFGEICRQVNESVKDPVSEGVEYVIGLEHIEPNNLHLTRWDTLEKGTTFTRKFKKGQVLFGRRRAYQRKVAYAEFDGICSGDILVFEAIEEKLIPRLLPFIVQSEGFFGKALSTSAGSLSPRTKFKELADYELLLPESKEEQACLAELLWAADEVVMREKRMKEKLEKFIVHYFDNVLFADADVEINLKQLGKVIRGVSYKPEDLKEIYSDSTFALLRSNNIGALYLNYVSVYFVSRKRLKEEQVLQRGDIAICMSNGSKELVGKAAEFIDGPYPVFSVGSFCSIFRPDKTPLGELSKYIFQSRAYRQQISMLLSGSNINNLKPADIENISLKINSKVDLDLLKYKLNLLNESILLSDIQLNKSGRFKRVLVNQMI